MAGDQDTLALRGVDAIDAGYVIDFHILLRAIEQAMPGDAVLFLEGTSTAPAVAAFLREHEIADPPAMAANERGFSERFHLPLEQLAPLRLLAEDHPSPEIASHLAVYRDRDVLLWAHDAGYGLVQVSRSLPDETIERFRTALGTAIRPPKRYGFFRLFRARDH
jgi:hypothetical protein